MLHRKIRCTEWSPSLSFLCPWCRGSDWGPTHMFVSGCPRSPFPSLTWPSLELFGSAVITELIRWPPTSPTTPSLLLQVGTTLHTMHTSRVAAPPAPTQATLRRAASATAVDSIFPPNHEMRTRFREALPPKVAALLPPLPPIRVRAVLAQRQSASVSCSLTHPPPPRHTRHTINVTAVHALRHSPYPQRPHIVKALYTPPCV